MAQDPNQLESIDPEIFFHMGGDLICIADLDTAKFLKINKAFVDILGYSEEELLGKPFTDFIHPDDLSATMEIMEQELKLGKSVIHFQNRYKTKEGDYRWFSWNAYPLQDKKITYAVAHDITDQKAIEEKYRTYIESSPFGVFVANEKGRYVEVNQAACDITGYSRDELTQIAIPDITSKESLADAMGTFQTLLSEGGKVSVELLLKKKDGSEIWWRVDAVKISENRVLGFTLDINDTKNYEKQLRAKIEELERINKLTLGRETRMIELKKKIEELENELEKQT